MIGFCLSSYSSLFLNSYKDNNFSVTLDNYFCKNLLSFGLFCVTSCATACCGGCRMRMQNGPFGRSEWAVRHACTARFAPRRRPCGCVGPSLSVVFTTFAARCLRLSLCGLQGGLRGPYGGNAWPPGANSVRFYQYSYAFINALSRKIIIFAVTMPVWRGSADVSAAGPVSQVEAAAGPRQALPTERTTNQNT